MRRLAALAALSALAACAPQHVGPAFTQDAAAVTDASPAPNIVSLAHAGGEKWDTRSTVPGGYARLYDADGVAVESIGPRARLISLPGPGGLPIRFAADDVVDLRIDEYAGPEGVLVKGMSLRMDSAAQTKAQNEALDRLVSYWSGLTAAQRDAAVAQIEANRAAFEAVAPGLIDALRLVLGGL